MTDQYDAVLRALEPGTLIGVNWSTDSKRAAEVGELEVQQSRDNETAVHATDGHHHYKIHRDRHTDELRVDRKSRPQGFEPYAEVVTIELMGIASGGDQA